VDGYSRGPRVALSADTTRPLCLTFKALALLLLLGALLAGFAATPAWAAEELFVTNYLGNSITVYTRTADGDIAPIRTISGGSTGLSRPTGYALDPTNDELFVANDDGNTITVYDRTDFGDSPPLRTISGGSTGLNGPRDLAIDPTHNELVVANTFGNSITVYNLTDTGNASPLRTISGPATGLSNSRGLALDLTHNELFVGSGAAHSITVYSRTANGDSPPLRTISGGSTGLNGPRDLALDLTHDELFVTNFFGDAITVYSRTANGNAPPTRTISGGSTGVRGPTGLALDLTNDELFVANWDTHAITVYDRTDFGNIAPLRAISGGSTGLGDPTGLALGPATDTADTTPDPFTFTDVTGVPLSTVQTSNAITVTGITAPAPITIVSGTYEVNNSGTFTSSAGTVNNGDTVRVRHTSAATPSTAVNTALTIGGVADTFTSTTVAAPNGPDLTGAWGPVTQICYLGRCTLEGSVRVWNQGDATAHTSRLRVILSGDAVMDPGDSVLQELRIRSLAPGQDQTKAISVRLPRRVNASGKYLFAVIDALNSVTETNETNNEPMYGPIP